MKAFYKLLRYCLLVISVCIVSFNLHAQLIFSVAGTNTRGFSGDGGPAKLAMLNKPCDVAIDTAGDIYFTDENNNCVRKISAANGKITTIAGTGVAGYNGDNIKADTATLNDPRGIAVDKNGNVYVADYGNRRVRKISRNGKITTVAGNGQYGYNGDGIKADQASLVRPSGIAFDITGNLYIADELAQRILKINVSDGIIHTVAGNGEEGFSGDDGLAINARLSDPSFMALDTAGNIYFSDATNFRVRKINTATGIITTIAGNGQNGYAGDGGKAKDAAISIPYGITIDSEKNIYFADILNLRIRKISAIDSTITTFTGNGSFDYSGDSMPAVSSGLSMLGIKFNKRGVMFIGDSYSRVLKIVPVSLLPIKLVEFTVSNAGKENILNWQTCQEINTSNFNIERSSDSRQFIQIGSIQATGNSSITQTYNFADAQPLNGINYYRLKMVDKDGVYTYSAIKTVVNSAAIFSAMLYPNPVHNTASIQFKSNKLRQVKIDVVDINGKVVLTARHQVDEGSVTKNIDIRRLPAGTYLIRINSDGREQAALKFVKE